MTDREHPENLHEQHVRLLREVLETQQELIEVLNKVAKDKTDDVSYRTLAERQSE